jgi:hypothetical protein
MIAGFQNLQSFNDGQTKKVSVFALEDASGGMETVQFQILDQTKTVTVNFAANQGQVVTMVHDASGTGLVVVTAANSGQSIRRILNVDKQPGDKGTAA